MGHVHRVLVVGLTAVSLASCASAPMTGHDGASAPLAQEVRRATQRFQDVAAARDAGYGLFLGCVTGPQHGAMGIHYVNGDQVADGKVDAARPEALMYEPKGGTLELIGVEYIVPAAAWDAANKTPPTLMGQLFHYHPSPNRDGIPAFYSLHSVGVEGEPPRRVHGLESDRLVRGGRGRPAVAAPPGRSRPTRAAASRSRGPAPPARTRSCCRRARRSRR